MFVLWGFDHVSKFLATVFLVLGLILDGNQQILDLGLALP